MQRGRKPKPSYLRVLDGNAGKRPLNPDEPKPEGELLAPPHWMTDTQKDLWRVALSQAPPGLLKSLDASIFTIWVVACDRHREATEQVNKYGLLVKSPTGVPMQSPYLSMANKQAQIMMKSCAEMGFTPSSRSRVKVEKPARTDSPFAGLRTLPD